MTEVVYTYFIFVCDYRSWEIGVKLFDSLSGDNSYFLRLLLLDI